MVASEEGKALTFRMWHQELHTLLIQQGLQGYTERALVRYFKNRVHEDELKGYLELLLKEDKAQKFKYKRDFYWRATINLPTKQ
jgi:hypothetical protein